MKRHSLDPFSLVFGITFAALGGVFLVSRLDASQLHLQWVWPIPMIALGVLIVALAGMRTSRERREPAPEGDRGPLA